MIEQLFSTPMGWVVVFGVLVAGALVAGGIANCGLDIPGVVRAAARRLRPRLRLARPQPRPRGGRLLSYVPEQGRHRKAEGR